MSTRQPPRDRTRAATAHRPLVAGPGRKRSLSHVGGAIETYGDPDIVEVIGPAFSVRAGERDATLTHPFHAYPARLHPEVARQLVAEVVRSNPRGTLLDPFCGSGTVLVEGMTAGLASLGTDLSPLAIELARVKTRRTTAAERKSMVEAAHQIAREAAKLAKSDVAVRHPRGEEQWFHPHTLREVSALALAIEGIPAGFVRDALRMLLSSVLVKVSLQASDSDVRRVPDKPVRPGAAPHFFARKSLELDTCLAALARAVPRDTAPADAHLDDATALRTIADHSIDAVITSPPYANTYDYVDHHTRRYRWLRMDPTVLEAREVGAARWFAKPAEGTERFAFELHALCKALSRVLRSGARAYVVMADGAAGKHALYTDDLLSEAVEASRLRIVAAVSQARPTFDEISARAFRKRPKREHLVVLERD